MGKNLGDVIKTAMAEKSLSLRKLSELCEISPSTVSRIINNKQPANIGHLQSFSSSLQIPLPRLIEASGIDMGEKTDENSEIILGLIHNILESYEIKFNEVVPEIRKDLKKYEYYARTADGKKLIQSGFLKKINSLNGEGVIINQLKKLYDLYCSEETELPIQSIAGSALLYLVNTADVIPDYVFPIGHLDDAVAVVLTVKRLENNYNIMLS